MFQIRGSDGRAYRPGRDIGYVYPDIARYAMYRLCKASWHDVIKDYAEYTGLTEQALAEGAAALGRFIDVTANTGVQDVATAWVNAGLDRLPKPVLLAVMFELGVGLTATWFKAAKEVTRAGHRLPGGAAYGAVSGMFAAMTGADLPSKRAALADEISKVIDDQNQTGQV